MKKFFLLVICIGAIISCAASCKSDRGNGKKHAVQDKGNRQDEASDGDAGFITPDLLLFGVKGHVKSVETNDGKEKVRITFDDKGLLASYPCTEGSRDFIFKDGKAVGKYFSSKRNANGQLVRFAYEPYEDMDEHWYTDIYELTYNASGRVVTTVQTGWESSSTTKHEYDGKELCTREVCEGMAESLGYKVITTYTYTKFDDRGNWTERKCKMHSVEWEGEEETAEKNTSDATSVEKRVITYYR